MAKTTTQKMVSVDTEYLEKLNDHMEENGMTFSGLIRVLLKNYLKEKGLI